MIMKKNILIIVCLLLVFSSSVAYVPGEWSTKEITIITYNILNFPGSTGAGRVEYFQKVIDEIDPDIIVVQEILSQDGTDMFLDDVLNYDIVEYSASPFINGPDTDNLIFYKDSRINYIETETIPTDLRDISAYKLSLVDKPEFEFIIYSLHLKASQGSTNENRRYLDVLDLKEHADNLPLGYHFIVAGDFNVYYSNEPAYQVLMNDFTIDLYDPIDRSGYWHNNYNYRDIHTQSTRTTQFGGGASGGLDDRFDFILLSEPFGSSYGLKYVEDSYFAFGNDGNHFNQDINYGLNGVVSEEIADALYYATDHLPVVASFEYKIKNERYIDLRIRWIRDI